MSSPKFLVENKKVLQAHVDGAILGQSATQLYTYGVFLWRVPIIITTNNWDLGSLSEADRDWIKQNCVVVLIDSPVWETPQKVTAPRPRAHSPPRAEKRSLQALTPQQTSPQRKFVATCCPTCGQPVPDKA